jgi:peptidoglycan/LPS O-acetylase OafA/YrhL
VIYPLAIIFTITLASLSYYWYESYFMKLKSRFAIVKSGSEV